MKWKNRLTNYNFWISIVSATLLILQAFNIKLDIANINEIVTALLGLLVVIGIINDPTKSTKDTESTKTKTDKTTSSIKHKKGCALAEDNDNANQNENNETDSSANIVLPDIDANEAETQETDTAGVEEQPCPACEEIKNAEQSEDNLQQNTDNLNAVEQPSSELHNQAFEAIMEGEIPSAEQNAADYDIAENDLQVLIKQISQDIKDKYAELNKLAENLNFVANKQNNIDATVIDAATDNSAELSKEMEQDANILAESTLQKKQEIEPHQVDNQADICDNKVANLGQISDNQYADISQENAVEQTEIPTHFNIVN